MSHSDRPLCGTQSISEQGHLAIGGCDTVKLAEEFGTPLYVMDEALVRENCRAYRQEFGKRLKRTEVAYAGKALLTSAMCRVMTQEGMALDVAGRGELYTAVTAGTPTDRIKLHGNFKSDELLAMACDHKVGRIVADSPSELERLSKLATERGWTPSLLLRVNPSVKPQTHSHIQTGAADSKFGLSIASGAAMEGIRLAHSLPNLNLRGVHCHIGSQVQAATTFARTVETMVQFVADVKRDTGWECDELDVGGGLGIAYTSDDAPPTIAELAESVCSCLQAGIRDHGLSMPKLIVEPGRSIVGSAGTTLYRVGPVKHIPGIRTYVAVDGGLSDNPRPAMYGAKYAATIANKADRPATMTVRVAGAHCESDTLIPETDLQPVEEGDLLAVFCTGAYNYSMASNYNRFTRPAMVLVGDGKADLIRRRESLDDLIVHDVIPERLQDGPDEAEDTSQMSVETVAAPLA